MKFINSLRPYAAALFVCLFAASCTDDKSSNSNEPAPTGFAAYEYSGLVWTTTSSNGTSSTSQGYVTITASKQVTVELLSGSLVGLAQKTGNSYSISVTQASGAFSYAQNITGSIETVTGAISLSGTNPDGSTLTLVGNIEPVEVVTDGGWGSLQKASVLFTHDEDLIASITINGVTLDGLNAHHDSGSYCNPDDALYRAMRFDFDTVQSRVYCATFNMVGVDGQPLNFTDCSCTRFVLDKNTTYTYTVNWSNGTTTTGEVATLDAGFTTFVCLSPPTGSTGGTLTNSFSIGNYSTTEVDIVTCDYSNQTVYNYFQLTASNLTDDKFVKVELPTMPTTAGTYTVMSYNPANPPQITAGQAYVKASTGIGNSNTSYHSTGGGQVEISIVDGKVRAEFTNISLTNFFGTSTTTASGAFTCTF